jgi:hypothetical protein
VTLKELVWPVDYRNGAITTIDRRWRRAAAEHLSDGTASGDEASTLVMSDARAVRSTT